MKCELRAIARIEHWLNQSIGTAFLECWMAALDQAPSEKRSIRTIIGPLSEEQHTFKSLDQFIIVVSLTGGKGL